MGTRNLTMVVVGGEYKLAQYGQWDGYPSGQGATALKFCRKYLQTKKGREEFKAKLANVRFVMEAELQEILTKLGVPDGMLNMDQVNEYKRQWPAMSRDVGAEILNVVRKSKGEVLTKNEIDFVRDSLFCEWAYVIDLTKLTFEVFKGFVTEPLDKTNKRERFAHLPLREEKPGSAINQYYPVKHVVSFRLDKLPTGRDFCKLACPPEEEE